MMLYPKILEAVEKEEFKARCLKAWICPDCGAELRDVGDENHDIEPGCLSEECSSTGTRKRFRLFGSRSVFESYKIPKTQW